MTLRPTIYVSKSVGANPRGHYSSLYKGLAKTYKDCLPTSEFGVLAQIGVSVEDFHAFFIPQSNLQGRVFTPWSLKLHKYSELCEFIQLRNWQSATFVIYEGDIQMLVIALKLIAKFPKIRVIFNFHYSDFWVDYFSRRSLMDVMNRGLLMKSMKTAGGRLIFAAESPKLASFIGSKLGAPVLVFPVVSAFAKQIERNLPAKSVDVFACPMGIDETNFTFSVFKVLKGKVNGLQLSIQARGLNKSEHETLSKRAAEQGIEWVEYPLTELLHEKVHSQSKVIFFPYTSKFYEYGSSGRVQDSIAFQAFPVVPVETAMGEWLSRFGMPTFTSLDVTSAANAILLALDSNFSLLPPSLGIQDLADWVNSKSSFLPTVIEQPFVHRWAIELFGALNLLKFVKLKETIAAWKVEYRALAEARGTGITTSS